MLRVLLDLLTLATALLLLAFAFSDWYPGESVPTWDDLERTGRVLSVGISAGATAVSGTLGTVSPVTTP